MRILILNQPFYPDVVATAQHMADLASHLAARGHQVTVIASRSVYGKQGAILPKFETWNNISIHRVNANLFKKGRLLTRLVDFGLFHLAALRRALFLPHQDVVLCLTTPPMIGGVGMLMKIFKGSRYVQYEMDVYPDVAVALHRMRNGSLAHRLFSRIQRKLLKSADRVIVLGRCMQRILVAKGVPQKKLVLVTPWADPEEIRPIPLDQNLFRQQYCLQDKFVVMYSGNLGLGHDISTLTAAMRQLHAENQTDIAFVFIGGGKRMEEIQAFCQSSDIPAPLILEYQPRENLSQTLSAADVHLITQAPRTSGLIVPSKLYGILAAGKNTIYIGPRDTEAALTLMENNLGTVLEIGETQKLVDALESLKTLKRIDPAALAEQEAAARHLLISDHSRQVCCRRLTEMLEQLAQTRIGSCEE